MKGRVGSRGAISKDAGSTGINKLEILTDDPETDPSLLTSLTS